MVAIVVAVMVVMVMVAVVATIAAVRVVCIIIIEAQDLGAYDSRKMNYQPVLSRLRLRIHTYLCLHRLSSRETQANQAQSSKDHDERWIRGR